MERRRAAAQSKRVLAKPSAMTKGSNGAGVRGKRSMCRWLGRDTIGGAAQRRGREWVGEKKFWGSRYAVSSLCDD